MTQSSGIPADVVVTPERRALWTALERVHGSGTIGWPAVDYWYDLGWTGTLVDQVSVLAHFAQDRDLPIGTGAAGVSPAHQEVVRRLANFSDILVQRLSLARADTLPWVAVVAGTPRKLCLSFRPGQALSATFPILRQLAITSTGEQTDDGHESLLAQWVTTAPSEKAALAWMARLTPEETAARYETGGLDLAALRTLAGLHGYLMLEGNQ